ncbi:MAG: methyltransferase domain-containing protein [Candidatus Binataceae bacterium]|nr:methyltransferase domain-containing protein [Candidatus Binataceae bacterium]
MANRKPSTKRPVRRRAVAVLHAAPAKAPPIEQDSAPDGPAAPSPAAAAVATPDRAAAIAQYRSRVPVYDFEIAPAEPMRRRAIARLALTPGETVIDAGCGTGLSLRYLTAAVGPAGAVIGIEQSPDMIARAQARVARRQWANVTLINSPAEDAAIPAPADAVIFHFTHDLLQTERALENILGNLKPGGRVVATGLKWAPWWSPAVNLFVRIAAQRSTTTMAGLDQPWRHLAPLLTGLVVEATAGGGTFLAYGVRR